MASKIRSHYYFDGVGMAVALAGHLDLTAAEKLVLVYIGGSSGRDWRAGEFFQAQGTVAAALGLSEKGVRKAMLSLEEAGVIERTGETYHRAVVYRVRLSEMCESLGVSAWGEKRAPEAAMETVEGAETSSVLRESTSALFDSSSVLRSPSSVQRSDNQMHYQMQDQMRDQNPPPPPAENEALPGLDLAADAAESEEPEPDPGPGFEDFYSLYPRKEKPGAAERAWRNAVKRTDPEVIMSGLRARLPHWQHTERRFIPHPASWLNARSWEDELPSSTRVATGWEHVPSVDEVAARYGW